MCGIAGIVEFGAGRPEAGLRAVALRMARALQHRGPDEEGVWTDPPAGVALSHRRLSILDLSENGRQPMVSACGRHVITFNGEIYNYCLLREELGRLGCRFRGTSDTEVLLAAIAEWGVERTLGRLDGMFAFAVWDRTERKLVLARDRFGEKPLYYAAAGHRFIFGSELKALAACPDFPDAIDRSSVALLLRFGCVPAPYTIYRDVCKLLPGTWMIVEAGKASAGTPRPYWSARDTAIAAMAGAWNGGEQETLDELDARLRTTVQSRMVSDVPLGALLSGGIDSTAVVAVMQAVSTRPVKTFTIGFREGRFNEAYHAQKVARHLGTEHTEMLITPETALAVIPKLPHIYDEPFADSSQLPTLLVSELARRHVTVALSGDGGDEIFGGYLRYQWGRSIWAAAERIPLSVRRVLGHLAESAGSETGLMRWLPMWGTFHARHRLHHLGQVIPVETQDELYLRLVSFWTSPENVVLQSESRLSPSIANAPFSDIRERMMLLDTMNYLPDDILVKLDRASMAFSLETRVPFLSADLFRFAWSLPARYRFQGKSGKWILRRLLTRYVPQRLIDRPKMGFAVPIDEWLRGPLREWAASLLDSRRLGEERILNPAPVQQKWEAHLAGGHNGHRYLWTVLMFQAWLEQARRDRTEAAARQTT
ncbi:MAG: asparagine synthase (glutamine-hydrolyzing) [Bryobacteraceae bacterium]